MKESVLTLSSRDGCAMYCMRMLWMMKNRSGHAANKSLNWLLIVSTITGTFVVRSHYHCSLVTRVTKISPCSRIAWWRLVLLLFCLASSCVVRFRHGFRVATDPLRALPSDRRQQNQPDVCNSPPTSWHEPPVEQRSHKGGSQCVALTLWAAVYVLVGGTVVRLLNLRWLPTVYRWLCSKIWCNRAVESLILSSASKVCSLEPHRLVAGDLLFVAVLEHRKQQTDT